MKHFLLKAALILFMPLCIFAQTPYQFTTTNVVKGMDVEDQCATGTCWSFATISFIEAEIIRKNKTAVDLSEMFNVRYTYPAKAESYVRFQGKQQFGPGGLSQDVIAVIKKYGMVPESAYTGLPTEKKLHDHSSLDAILGGTVKTVLDGKLNTSSDDWMIAINGILDAYLGKAPERFEWNNKQYSPLEFRDAMGINADDYVNLSSFSHHPYYSTFVLEVPDNWMKGAFYNVTLDELQQIADNALENGYTIAWDADVSEEGFSFQNGMAIVPEGKVAKEELFKKYISEQKINQDIRQKAFDNFETTDDHLMHITGKAKDQNGTVYYITKNSWGTGNNYGGYQYVSSSYFRYKTVSMVVHKDAIPAAIRTKLKI
ncbi:MAG: aminopeptidase C [Flavobacteriales bacterium]|jgi:bleomycin hydrolase